MTSIAISLAYVTTDGVGLYQQLSVPVGTSLRKALHLSGWLENKTLAQEFASLIAWLNITDDKTLPNHKAWYVGIFSQKQPLGYQLKADDRVEIYRPLSLDPMKRRHKKAKISNKQH